MHFGYVLKTLRIEAGVGLRELARTIDVSPSYLSMIENGQQQPPVAARITQIEEALNVPSGYLFSITSGLDPDLTSFVQNVPEARDFLHVAMKKSMSSADFLELTGLVNAYGWEGVKKALREVSPRAFEPAEPPHPDVSRGPYLWPFLDEKLIFDVKKAGNKESFLKEAIDRIARRTSGLNPRIMLNQLLDRERIASTGIGHGVAVPHVYTDELDQMVTSLFRIPSGLDFDSIDGQPVYLVFILAGSRSAENLHLRLLARIAKLFSRDSVYKNIVDASSHREIISVLKLAELRIP